MIIDYHSHSLYSDGESNIKSIVEIAKSKGLSGIGITDHALSWDEGFNFFRRRSDFLRYYQEIRNYSAEGLVVLAGLECDISPEGKMITSEGIKLREELETGKLDYVIASFHPEWSWWSTIPDATVAVLRAVQQPEVSILGHPFSLFYETPITTDYFMRLYDVLAMENADGHKVSFELNRKEFFMLKDRGKIDDFVGILDLMLRGRHIPISYGSDAHCLRDIGNTEFITEIEKMLGYNFTNRINGRE